MTYEINDQNELTREGLGIFRLFRFFRKAAEALWATS